MKFLNQNKRKKKVGNLKDSSPLFRIRRADMKKCHFIPQKEEEEEETNLSTYMYDTVYIEESKREREKRKEPV